MVVLEGPVIKSKNKQGTRIHLDFRNIRGIPSVSTCIRTEVLCKTLLIKSFFPTGAAVSRWTRLPWPPRTLFSSRASAGGEQLRVLIEIVFNHTKGYLGEKDAYVFRISYDACKRLEMQFYYMPELLTRVTETSLKSPTS